MTPSSKPGSASGSGKSIVRRSLVAAVTFAAMSAGAIALLPSEAAAQPYGRYYGRPHYGPGPGFYGPRPYYGGRGYYRGGGVAAGVIGGLALGALAAGALAAPGPVYPAPVYDPGPVGCYFERQRVWDGYGYVWQRVRVCN